MAFGKMLAGVLLVSLAVPATAQTADQDTLQTTYNLSFKCYVANQVASGDSRYNADGSHTDTFARGRDNAYRVIWQLGRALGRSDALIEEDFSSYERMYRARFGRDDAYFQRARSDCQRIGLM